jgi:RNA polymerase sigma-70 factor (ECF subfamily)
VGSLIQLTRASRPDASTGPLEARSDEELMGLSRLNVRAAFRLLVVRHAEKVASFCGRIAGDRSAGPEIAQAVWLSLWDARGRWEARSTFASFLYTIAFTRARNHARSRSRSAGVFDPAAIVDDSAGASDPSHLDRLLEVERRERVEAAIEGLPTPMREAVVLRFVEGQSYEQMETLLRVPSSTLRSRVHHALARLRAALEEAP